MNEQQQVPVRKGDWMQTASGLAFWPLDPRADEVKVQDIAHALSQQARYAGHTPEPYSVAQHSVLCAEWIEANGGSPLESFHGLLHDATEAYLVDLPRPVKKSMPKYQEVEDALERVIAEAFGLPLPMPAIVKRADEVILACEAAMFFPTRPIPWNLRELPDPAVEVFPWEWRSARSQFLQAYYRLLVAKG